MRASFRSALPVLLPLLAMLAACSIPLQAAELRPKPPALGLGQDLNLEVPGDFTAPPSSMDAAAADRQPFHVRIRASWGRVEPTPGNYAWDELDRLVGIHASVGHVVILCLYGGHSLYDEASRLPASTRPALLKGWLNLFRAAALHFKGRVRYYELGDAPNLQADWAGTGATEYAFVLKSSSVVVRSADPEAFVVQGRLDHSAPGAEAARAWQAALYREGIASYVDAVAMTPATGEAFGPSVAALYDLLLEHDPSAQLWVTGVDLEGESDNERAADLVRRFVVAQGEGAALVTFNLKSGADGQPEFPGVLLDLRRLFLPTYSRRPGKAVRFVTDPESDGAATIAYSFFDADSYQGLVAFFSPDRHEGTPTTLVLDTAAVRGVSLYDIAGGAAGPVSGARADFSTNTTHVPVTLRGRPQVLLYARVPVQGFEASKEQVAVSDTGLITVEEIIANHQRFMADQEYRLESYRAAGRVGYHYKISGSNTIDIAYDNTLFWERDRGAEWQQTALYFNGVRWKAKKFPDIPFIQPDQVVSLPLDIQLNRDYEYRYVDREQADGYDCYVVAFRPLDPTRTLYEGKIWIETRTFARIRASVVQTGLEPPLTSSDERNHYAPVAGPDGFTYWLLKSVEGQQIYNTAGRNLVVLREITLDGFVINDPGFAEIRGRAYASDDPILRETEKGFRYLEKDSEGGRTIETDPPRKTLFAIGGLFAQSGLDYPLPLLGVNYFNYNVAGKNAQLNAFLGGVVNLITFSDPKLFGPFDGAVEAFLFGVDLTDVPYVDGSKRTESNVDRQNQRLSAWLGLPLGNFFRLRGEYGFEYAGFSRDKETDTFDVPSDTAQHSFALLGEFNRAGWTVTAEAGRTMRHRWDPWGDSSPPGAETAAGFPGSPCDTPGSCLSEFDSSQDVFDTREYSVAKQFFLPAFQKIRLEGTWLAGDNFDRFSQFAFEFFGLRLRGFSGSGVRFDDGGVARLQYAFNLHDVVRFEASLDHARVRDRLTSDDTAQFTGFGVSGNVLGPWQTILSFDAGVALQSDIPGMRGDTEFQVILLKFF